jgi:hypothetical protein
MKRYLYLIDGVSVPRRTYFQRQRFGEYPSAVFRIVEIHQ